MAKFLLSRRSVWTRNMNDVVELLSAEVGSTASVSLSCRVETCKQ